MEIAVMKGMNALAPNDATSVNGGKGPSSSCGSEQTGSSSAAGKVPCSACPMPVGVSSSASKPVAVEDEDMLGPEDEPTEVPVEDVNATK